MLIEQITREYLQKALGLPVCLETPENAPASFVRLEKTGSGKSNHICRATLAVQSYGARLAEAAELNERVKAAMEDMAELPEICSVRLNSDYNFSDTATRRYRYQAVFDVVHYAL